MNKTEERTYTLDDALMGGPGLDGYAYNAAIYCEDCGKAIAVQVFGARGGKPMSWTEFTDSENLPQPVFFGESDCAQHCDDCGDYCYGPEEENDTIELDEA